MWPTFTEVKRNNDSGHCERYFLNMFTSIKVNGTYKNPNGVGIRRSRLF